MIASEQFEKEQTASYEVAKALKFVDDEMAITILLCAIVGIAVHAKMTREQVIKILTEIYGELDAPEESMN
jgi:hypothetical protein